MSNITSCDSGSFSTENTREDAVIKPHTEALGHNQFHSPNSLTSTTTNSNGSNNNSQLPTPSLKKKRSLPGNPDPSAEVIALSPNTLMARNRFVCEICNKGFQRDQNLQLHRRGHNLPWKLKQRTSTEVRKRVYVCPEPSCVHHNPARALGDLTGIKKHFSRKHGEKKWKCDKCSKRYAVQSDWKAHSKICGTREYKCDCGTIFSRRDSFITHRAFCDALAEENNKGNIIGEVQLPKLLGSSNSINIQAHHHHHHHHHQQIPNLVSPMLPPPVPAMMNNNNLMNIPHIGTSQFINDDVEVVDDIKDPLSSSSSALLLTHDYSNVFTRSLSSMNAAACPSLQLSSNNNNMFEENNNNNEQQSGGSAAAASAHMSATALLQKAAQMGATMSNGNGNCSNNNGAVNNSCMAPASFGSFMMNGGQHDPISTTSYLSTGMMMGGGGSNNVNNNNNNSVGGMNSVDMFNAILDQSKALSKMIEQNNNSRTNINNGLVMHGGEPTSNKANGDVMTLDFLGIGGATDATTTADHAFLWRQTG